MTRSTTTSRAPRAMRAGALVLSAYLAISAMSAVTAGATGSIDAHGSVEQVYVTGLTPGAQMALISPSGAVVATRLATAKGGMLFRKVTPDSGYVVREGDGTDLSAPQSAPVTVHTDADAPWDTSFYNQPIVANGGYGYLTTRDGTKLAYTVNVPTSPAGQKGAPQGTPVPSAPAPFLPPYPTLIEYSGYGYANPAGPQSGIAILANLMGYAVVDINMRGTGCSAGAFDFFEPLQNLDGYDIVETIARQPWVLHNTVGMMGISYGGISQLFTAQHQPPSLAAISPLSVIDASATTLYPGGVLNTGFAVAWSEERQREAQAGPEAGQRWARDRINAGDTVCRDHQALHGEAANLTQAIEDNAHYNAVVADPLDPITFVDKITVPTFMACQWQDEQTGGHCAELARRMTGTDKKWFTFTNGPHIDSLAPETYNKWYDFLELYVAKRAPITNQALTRAAAPVVYNAAMGIPAQTPVLLPVDPIQLMPTYDLALQMFEAQPSVRILFDNGAGASPLGDKTPGNPYPAFEKSFASWPVPGTVAQTWYLGANGALTNDAPASAGSNSYTSNASALPLTNYAGGTGGGGLWGNASQWKWNWKQNPAGTAVSYVSDPLPADTFVIGGGSVNLSVKSSTPDVDLQATITEVRPDDKETFVQNGYMRASERKLSTDSVNLFKRPSTLLDPIPSFLAADAAAMPADGFVPVTIPLYNEAHVYRAGSRIRITIAAPNGQQPVWSFSRTVGAGSNVSIAFSPDAPSTLVLPVVPGLTAPTSLPACPSLRNQPCRSYVPFTNGS